MKNTDLIADIKASTTLKERFLRYVQVDTQADPESDTIPTTMKQKDLSQMLAGELEALGLNDAHMDEFGFVYASYPGNNSSTKKVALLAHVDVAVDCKGDGVEPIVHENYDGGDIDLPSGLKITVDENPLLKQCLKDTIITSDGTTLLGADDKAGIAEIVALIEYLKKNPKIRHPTIKICFTPDEEVGKGVDKIDLKKIGADFGFTMDGGFPGEINCENFDAFSAKVTFKGINFHPGYAKDRMVSAIRYAAMFVDMLPKTMAPETTRGREPFIHPLNMTGNTGEATINLILRGFSIEDIRQHEKIIASIADHIRSVAPKLDIDIVVKESYRNMAEVLAEHGSILAYLEQAASELDIKLKYRPVRGGTDGAKLSFMGLPCPNIFAGVVNAHSPKEWISHEKMAQSVAFLVSMVQQIK